MMMDGEGEGAGAAAEGLGAEGGEEVLHARLPSHSDDFARPHRFLQHPEQITISFSLFSHSF